MFWANIFFPCGIRDLCLYLIYAKGDIGKKQMKKIGWKQILAIVAAFCILIQEPLTVKADEYWPDGPKTESESAVVMEVNTGTILYEKKSHKKQYPASITKIMTVLLAIENCDMDEIVTFSADAVFKNEGDTSHIARNLEEKLTMEQCLYAVMLESANECAYAVAEHVGQKLGGDYQTFIDLMNQRAQELGCKDTHFNNCNGLPDEEHYVSAYDMALISMEAYKNETFRVIAGSANYTIPKTNKCKEEYPCHNHHKMIYPYRGDASHLYEYCTGGKTGYTNAARNTLVSFAEKDGITLVCVVMKAETPSHYTDTRRLFDYCFENFQVLNVAENDTSLDTSGKKYGLLNLNEPYVKLEDHAYIIMPKAAKFTDAVAEEKQVNEDGVVARIQYTYADHVVGNVGIVKTGAKVEENYFEKQKEEQTDGAGKVILIKPKVIFLVVLMLGLLAILIYAGKKLYDNFYVIRHKIEVKKIDKERFRTNDRKKRRRRRDRMFK